MNTEWKWSSMSPGVLQHLDANIDKKESAEDLEKE